MINTLNGGLSSNQGSGDKSRVTEQSPNQQGPKAVGTASTADKVELSSQARTFKALEQEAKRMPEVDQEKVEQIKKAINDGEYSINPERLADAILRFEADA